MNDIARIFHIAQTKDIHDKSATEDYRCGSLTTEGFIHCCDKHQLAGVVSRYYGDVDDVHLLILEVGKLEAPLIHENTVGGSELFPHLYGPVNASAILEIIPFGINSMERQGLEL